MASTLSEVHPQPQKKWWRPFIKNHTALFDPFSNPFSSLTNSNNYQTQHSNHHHHQQHQQQQQQQQSSSSSTSQSNHPMRSSFLKTKHQPSYSLSHDLIPSSPTVFGARLEQSLELASVAISMVGQDKKAYIYGYIPVVVAKCGLYLKENATNVQGIFRISGSTKRMRELQAIFDEPPNYGKDLDWKTTNPSDHGSSSTSGSTGSLIDSNHINNGNQKSYFSVHDAANVLRRYLMSLPEPLIPYSMYQDFRNILNDRQKEKTKQVRTFKSLISTLPPSSQYLLLYLLDLLSVFALKSDVNLMTSANLAVVFQPGLCQPQPRNQAHLNRIIYNPSSSRPLNSSQPSIQQQSLDEQELIMRDVKEAQEVLQFLIDNQNYFVVGLRPQPKTNGTPHPNQPTDSPHRNERPSLPAHQSSRSLHPQLSHPNFSTPSNIPELSTRKLSIKRRKAAQDSNTSSSSDDPLSPLSPPRRLTTNDELILRSDGTEEDHPKDSISESPTQLDFLHAHHSFHYHQRHQSIPLVVKRSKTLPASNLASSKRLSSLNQLIGTPVSSPSPSHERTSEELKREGVKEEKVEKKDEVVE